MQWEEEKDAIMISSAQEVKAARIDERQKASSSMSAKAAALDQKDQDLNKKEHRLKKRENLLESGVRTHDACDFNYLEWITPGGCCILTMMHTLSMSTQGITTM